MKPYDPREDKLPGWARTTLYSLRREIETQNEIIAAFRQEPATGSPIGGLMLSGAKVGYEELRLPHHIIRFHLEGNSRMGAGNGYVEATLRDGKLSLNGGSDLLKVLPHAANHLVIGIEWEE